MFSDKVFFHMIKQLIFIQLLYFFIQLIKKIINKKINFFKLVSQHKILINSINNHDSINKYFSFLIYNIYNFVVLIFIAKFLKIEKFILYTFIFY